MSDIKPEQATPTSFSFPMATVGECLAFNGKVYKAVVHNQPDRLLQLAAEYRKQLRVWRAAIMHAHQVGAVVACLPDEEQCSIRGWDWRPLHAVNGTAQYFAVDVLLGICTRVERLLPTVGRPADAEALDGLKALLKLIVPPSKGDLARWLDAEAAVGLTAEFAMTLPPVVVLPPKDYVPGDGPRIDGRRQVIRWKGEEREVPGECRRLFCLVCTTWPVMFFGSIQFTLAFKRAGIASASEATARRYARDAGRMLAATGLSCPAA